MIFYKSKDFKVGLKIELNDEPFLIVENEFVNPGKGQAFNRLKLKSFVSGFIIKRTLKLGEKLKAADLFDVKAKYLYSSSDIFYFMNEESLDYYDVEISIVGSAVKWLLEGFSCNIIFWNNKVLLVKPLKFVELKVVSCDIVSNLSVISKSFKNAILETGVNVKVPLFVKIGDIIKVDTEHDEYVSRIN